MKAGLSGQKRFWNFQELSSITCEKFSASWTKRMLVILKVHTIDTACCIMFHVLAYCYYLECRAQYNDFILICQNVIFDWSPVRIDKPHIVLKCLCPILYYCS